MSRYQKIQDKLLMSPKVWLITGVAGFIGSNLLEKLLLLNQSVIGLDNFSTGHRSNLEQVKDIVSIQQWSKFFFIEGDICEPVTCKRAIKGVDYVLHQAALGSVPRSINDPITTNAANITGFLNMLTAAKEEQVKSFTYAASSSTYGDHPALPKMEENIGHPLSPYAVTKYVNELYANVFSRVYSFHSIGLRYFNVFGQRQDPNGSYAAVIPKWISSMIKNKDIYINGDGETSRDFCFIENTIQMNLLAATANKDQKNKIYNVAVGDRTTLNDLFITIKCSLEKNGINYSNTPIYSDFRIGDVRHSQADISKAIQCLGYEPKYKIHDGILKTVDYFLKMAK